MFANLLTIHMYYDTFDRFILVFTKMALIFLQELIVFNNSSFELHQLHCLNMRVLLE